MDREYTAQIRKRDEFGVWRPCGNTTFIVHGRFRPSLFNDDLIGYRRSVRYGAGIVDPKYRFSSFSQA